jgi:hypothetical protein
LGERAMMVPRIVFTRETIALSLFNFLYAQTPQPLRGSC